MSESANHSAVFDAERQHLADAYAKALLGIGDERGKTEELLSDLDSLVLELLPAQPQLSLFLESPRIPLDAKVSLLDKVFRDRVAPEFLNFLKVLGRKNRFDCLSAIQRAARKMFNERVGKIEATLLTAQPVANEVRDQVTQRLESLLGRQVDLVTETDESLIGGLVIRVGDTVYDGSLANEFERFRTSAIERSTREIRDAFDRFAVEA